MNRKTMYAISVETLDSCDFPSMDSLSYYYRFRYKITIIYFCYSPIIITIVNIVLLYFIIISV